jgi:hypothetical protein
VIRLLADDPDRRAEENGEPQVIVSQPQPMFFDVSAARSVPTCSFCGRDLWEVDHYVAGPSAFICDLCIAAAHDVLDDASDEQALRLPPRVFGLPPHDDPNALEEISEVLNAVFGAELTEQSARYVEHGEQLVPIIISVRKGHDIRVTEVLINRVRFANRTTVDFEMILDNGARFPVIGTMIRKNNHWLVTRETVAAALKPARASLPPPGT